MNRPPQYERGYTLQELLVVLLVGSLVISYSLSLLLSVLQVLGRTEKTIHVRDAVAASIQTIALDVQKSVRAETEGDSLLFLTLPGNRALGYGTNQGRLTRNGELMVPDSAIRFHLLVRLTDSAGVEARRDNRVFISISGEMRGICYESSARVATLPGGKETFEAVSGTIPHP